MRLRTLCIILCVQNDFPLRLRHTASPKLFYILQECGVPTTGLTKIAYSPFINNGFSLTKLANVIILILSEKETIMFRLYVLSFYMAYISLAFQYITGCHKQNFHVPCSIYHYEAWEDMWNHWTCTCIILVEVLKCSALAVLEGKVPWLSAISFSHFPLYHFVVGWRLSISNFIFHEWPKFGKLDVSSLDMQSCHIIFCGDIINIKWQVWTKMGKNVDSILYTLLFGDIHKIWRHLLLRCSTFCS